MADKRSFWFVVFLVFVALAICGCNEAGRDITGEEDPYVGSDMRKFELQQRLEKKYSDPRIHYELGKIYQSEGLWDKAIFEFQISKSYDPVNWGSAAAIVKTLYQDGKKDRAVLMAEVFAEEASYSAASSLLLGMAFKSELLDDEALTCYQQAMRVAPDSAEVNKQVGYYYRSKNDLVRAEQYLRRSFEISPSPEVSGELGRLGIPVELPRLERVVVEDAVEEVDSSK